MQKQLPLYQCHKQVRAAKIVIMFTYEGVRYLGLQGGEQVPIDAAWLARNPAVAVGGYFVQYLEGDGYSAYSPAGPFEGGYSLVVGGIDFGAALRALKAGKKVARSGWNGKGLWLELQTPDALSKMTLPYVFINYPQDAQNTPGARVPWLASQTDLLAADWHVVEDIAASTACDCQQQEGVNACSGCATTA